MLWHALLGIVIFFMLSFIGIVIGWLSWDQDSYYGEHALGAHTVSRVLVTLSAMVASLVAASILLMFGIHAFTPAAVVGLTVGVLVYFISRAQLKRT
jgi:hypothetical protein